MIKKSFFILLLLGTIIFISPCNADEGDLSLGGSFGGVGLTGSGMGQYGSNGFGYGGYITYAPSNMFDLDINLVYSPHSNGANSANLFYGTIGLKTGFKFDQLSPFLTAGVGIYRNSIQLGGVSDSAAAFGFNVGGGMDIDLGKWFRMGLLVRFHPVFSKSISSGANGVDDLWDVLLRVGILFRTGTQGGWD
ncbi:MAG: outer membrane beta-barrel protein [Proteobacteria bacterium]|nr:outer membrane beta-barrel protein [Pseudomonadota bacterium]